MKHLLTLFLIVFALPGFAQQTGKTIYGPIPYRTFAEHDAHPLPAIMAGKIIKLISIEKNDAQFTDASGVEYTGYIGDRRDNPYIHDITPLSDIENSKKMFLNKTFWMRAFKIYEGLGKGNDRIYRKKIMKGVFGQKVTVTDIVLVNDHTAPFQFILKTETGKIGWILVSTSGTNADITEGLGNKVWFNDIFFTEDPKLKYHFDADTWEWLKMGIVSLGMTPEAVRPVEGSPKEINITSTAKGTREQWVYGYGYEHTYYYFENGKLIDY